MISRFNTTLVCALTTLMLVSCQSAYYSAMEKVGTHKRDILIDRVEEATSSQEDAKEEFISALEQLSNLPLKIETTDNNLEVQINSIDDLQIILNILGLTQTEILNIHYDQTSLTQYYLSHMVQNVISEH